MRQMKRSCSILPATTGSERDRQNGLTSPANTQTKGTRMNDTDEDGMTKNKQATYTGSTLEGRQKYKQTHKQATLERKKKQIIH
jgi:hypothetical protein